LFTQCVVFVHQVSALVSDGIMLLGTCFVLLNMFVAYVDGLNYSYPDEQVEDYFSFLDHHDPPLSLCNGITDGILYRIPPYKNCQLLRNPKQSTVVNLTLWWEEIERQKLKGQECYATSSTVTCNYKLFQGCVYSYKPVVNLQLTKEQCSEIIATKAYNGTNLELIRDGYWGSNDSSMPDTGIFYWESSITRVNYYVRTVSIAVNSVDFTIMTLSGTSDNCAATDGVCQTNEGWLMWEPQFVDKCRLKKGDTTSCLLTDNVVSCPELEISLTVHKTVEVCGLQIPFSVEGVYFTTELPISNLPKAALSDHAASRFQAHSTKRPKRHTSIVTTGEMNSRTHFLFDVVKEERVSEIQLIHQTVCKSTQALIRAVRYAAENGDPNMMIGTMMKNGKYKSRLHGDVVALWKCQPVQ